MENAETPTRQRVPVWVVITLAVLVAASGQAFFNESPFIGLAACVLVAYMHLRRRELSLSSRLMRALGLGAIIGVLTYPASLALAYVAGFVSGFTSHPDSRAMRTHYELPCRYMNPDEFVKATITEINKCDSTLNAVAVGALKIKIEVKSNTYIEMHLYNTYEACLSDTDNSETIIHDYVVCALDSLHDDDRVTLDSIIPIVKSNKWLNDINVFKEHNTAQGAEDLLWIRLNEELIVVYAQNRDSGYSFLNKEDAKLLGVDLNDDFLKHAINNLHDKIKPIELFIINDSLRQLECGGFFEASLVLDENVLEWMKTKVVGDPVIAIPERSLLFFCGNEDSKALDQMKKEIESIDVGDGYGITGSMFIYKDSKLAIYPDW